MVCIVVHGVIAGMSVEQSDAVVIAPGVRQRDELWNAQSWSGHCPAAGDAVHSDAGAADWSFAGQRPEH